MIAFRWLLTIFAVFCLNSALFAQRRYDRSEKKAPEKTDTQCTQPTNYMRPDCALADQVPSAYNMSARIDANGAYDVFMNASFIYWNVGQDGMDIGRTALFNDGGAATPAADAAVPTHTFKYKPGFKLGLGYGSDFDNWQFELEYTFLHEMSMFRTGSTAGSFAANDPIIVPNDWYVNLSAAGGATQEQMGKMISKWKVHIDILDGFLSRPFYQGQRLNITPYVGLRALWMRQTFRIISQFAENPVGEPAVSNNRSTAWALGPYVGTDFNWLLGRGFRIEFDTGMALLYMRYTTLAHTENFSDLVDNIPINGRLPERGYLRPINEVGAGLGWGTYCCNKRFHIDFSARYDFAIFWSQNMMRYTVGALANNLVGYANNIGDLYLHGLTFTSRFDF